MSINEEKECKDKVAYANRTTDLRHKDIFSYLYKSFPTLKLNE